MYQCGKCNAWLEKSKTPIEFSQDGEKVKYTGVSYRCPVCGFYMLADGLPRAKKKERRK